MNKRTFLKSTAAALMGGGLAAPWLAGCAPTSSSSAAQPLANWAGNVVYSSKRVLYPKTVAELQEHVKAQKKIRGLGSRHSFNRIADSDDTQISLEELRTGISLDKDAGTVTVDGGMKYGELAPSLHAQGFALHNLASLPHIAVAGACATATHGSGVTNGSLSTAVRALEFVNAAGDLVKLSRSNDGAMFHGAVVHLGALGIVTRITLEVEPAYEVQQVVYLNLPMKALESDFDAIMSAGYSVSLFTDWRNRNIGEVWIKSKAAAAPAEKDFYGAAPATRDVHPIETQSAEHVTAQMNVPGPWYERLPHFKMGFTPSAGKELQSEFFVPREHAFAAIMAIAEMHEKISPHLFISEIRTIRGDDLWMSPFYKTDCVALHTTWKQEPDAVMKLIPEMEARLAPFAMRPHWAKLFTVSPPVLQGRYPMFAAFRELVHQFDPGGKFRNEFLQSTLFA